jgi:hypothetical protein
LEEAVSQTRHGGSAGECIYGAEVTCDRNRCGRDHGVRHCLLLFAVPPLSTFYADAMDASYVIEVVRPEG